jgi:hypothetical protein
VASPFTSYGFNTYAWNTNGSSLTWSKTDQVASGQPISAGPAGTNNTITVTVPLIDFAANLPSTPGTTFYFDVYSTGTSAGQTAYDSLAFQGPIQGSFSATAQYNGTVLDQYTIASVPEPNTLALGAAGMLSLTLFRRWRK